MGSSWDTTSGIKRGEQLAKDAPEIVRTVAKSFWSVVKSVIDAHAKVEAQRLKDCKSGTGNPCSNQIYRNQ